MKLCRWGIILDSKETTCDRPAKCHITWPDGTTYWYCAYHYDIRIAFLKACGRHDVLKASGVES